MKEYVAKEGGRYTYVEDLIALQELALSITSMFGGCKNFVLAGCETSGSDISGITISKGIVYINGKIREFPGAIVDLSAPYYIVEHDFTENVKYAEEVTQHGRNIYSTIGQIEKPTGKQYIEVTDTYIPRIKEEFLGKYAMLLNHKKQTITGAVEFGSDVTVSGDLSLNKKMKINDLVRGGLMEQSFDLNGNGQVVFKKDRYTAKLLFGIDNFISVLINDTELFKISPEMTTIASMVKTDTFNTGIARFYDNDLINYGTDSDAGSININYTGFKDGRTRFRNFNVYDGKQSMIMTVNGASRIVDMYGVLQVTSEAPVGLSLLQSSYDYTSNSYQKYIGWYDKNGANVAQVGYFKDTDQLFRIDTPYSDIEINPKTCFNVTKPIKEQGESLADKYADKKSTIEALNNKVNTIEGKGLSTEDFTAEYKQKLDGIAGGTITDDSKGYVTGAQVKTEVDKLLVKEQNLDDLPDKAAARTNLEVQSTTEADKKYLQVENYFNEFADITEEQKNAIRDIFGVAKSDASYSKNETYKKTEVYNQTESDKRFAPIYKDSGWVRIKENLHARQIGNIVSIQGSVTVPPNKASWFQIPNEIGAPGQSIGGSYIYDVDNDNRYNRGYKWRCDAGSRDLKCIEQSGCKGSVDICITYFT